MPWLRSGDNAYLDPRIMQARALRPDDPDIVLKVRGFVWSISSYMAQFKTEYFISLGACWECGGHSTREMLDVCHAVGLVEPFTMDGLDGYRIIEDSDFVHVRSKKDLEHERNRRNDNRDQRLRWAIIARDGDNCRWCGVPVHWTGSPSNRKGTLDHLKPGEKGTVETMVVACLSCNSERQDDVDGSWARANELLPVPDDPDYGPFSRKWLVKYGHLKAIDESARGASAGIRESSGESVDGSAPAVHADPGAGADDSVLIDDVRIIPGGADHAASVGFSCDSDPADADHIGSVGSLLPSDPGGDDHAAPVGLPSSESAQSVSMQCEAGSSGVVPGDTTGIAPAGQPRSPSWETESESESTHESELSSDSVRTFFAQGPPKSGLAGSGRDGTGTGREGKEREGSGRDGKGRGEHSAQGRVRKSKGRGRRR